MNCKKQHFETPSVFHFQIRNQCLISILLLSMAEWRIISHCHWHQIGTSLGRPFHPSSLLPCCLLGPSGPVSTWPGSGRTDGPRTREATTGRRKLRSAQSIDYTRGVQRLPPLLLSVNARRPSKLQIGSPTSVVLFSPTLWAQSLVCQNNNCQRVT